MENQENMGKKTENSNHSELKMDIKVSWKKTNTSKSLNEGNLVVDHENVSDGEFSVTLNGENTKTVMTLAVDVLADKVKEMFGKTENKG